MQHRAQRQPLGEATLRVNNGQDRIAPSYTKAQKSMPHHESRKPGALLQTRAHTHDAYTQHSPSFQGEAHNKENASAFDVFRSHAAPSRLISHPEEYQTDPKRISQVSSLSTSSAGLGPGQKKDIGPWNLGKTLGEGATARVRKARHRTTGQVVAVKIVQKKDARMSQAGSLAALDRLEALMPETDQDPRRMPLGIEREVAIMKLIDHPNVMKLFDIWENRKEIYLVLEFVDRGELFDYITSKGKLEEPEAMKYWRQILSAVGYCHSFNICHRDLKPENILLNQNGVIKIADFGMAALRQTQNHQLNTSCGSPHYAAPEVIGGLQYVGDKVDIWSMGIILYATLAGSLPFDHPGPGLAGLLSLVKKGQYRMCPEFSGPARDLIARILRLSPHDRPTIKQIWRHPLLRKYNYLDDLSLADKEVVSLDDVKFERPVNRVSDIDRNVLRHLRSLWHTFTEGQLVEALLEPKPNDQQRFYALLKNYREEQLENYVPPQGLDYSNSDYHHMRPLNQIRKLSTRQFFQPSQDGHGQQIARFTVIGNGLRDQNDQFSTARARKENQNDSNQRRVVSSQVDRAPHPDRGSFVTTGLKPPPNKNFLNSLSASSSTVSNSRAPTRKGFHTRSSLASSTRSRTSTSGVVKPSVSHKRAIAFPHQKRPPTRNSRFTSKLDASGSISLDQGGGNEASRLQSSAGGRNMAYIRSKKPIGESTRSAKKRKLEGISKLWEDDVRQVSTSLGQEIDEAFNLQKAASIKAAAKGLDFRSRDGTQLSSFRQDDPDIESSPRVPHNLQAKSGKAWWDERPLPRPPGRTESLNVQLASARKHAEKRRASGKEGPPGYLDHVITHIDNLMEPKADQSYLPVDRRARSAPVPTIGEGRTALASIQENSQDGVLSVSDLQSQAMPSIDDRANRRDARGFEQGIRLVPASSITSPSPIKPTAPLNIRKKVPRQPALMTGALGAEPRPQNRTYDQNLRRAQAAASENIEIYEDVDEFEENSNGTMRHKAPWFKRSVKLNEDDATPENPLLGTTKKKGFGIGTLFKKKDPKERPRMKIVYDAEDTVSISQESYAGYGDVEDSRAAKELSARQIEPQQNWLARLFKVKPVQRHVCCTVSKRRARQEIVIIFKEWKKYGLTDVVVDKKRSIIFARIHPQNYLNVKELSFAAEIMDVVEHGNQNPFSIVQLTQEKGAASSLAHVADLLTQKFLERGMLMKDKTKAGWMIETSDALKR